MTEPIFGGCHCGQVEIQLTTTRPAELVPRACDCSFCMKHGAAWVSDPEGSLEIRCRGGRALIEYRQGSEAARMLMCSLCGVLVAVVCELEADEGLSNRGTLYGAANALALERELTQPSTVVSPQQLEESAKRLRWSEIWSPARIIVD